MPLPLVVSPLEGGRGGACIAHASECTSSRSCQLRLSSSLSQSSLHHHRYFASSALHPATVWSYMGPGSLMSTAAYIDPGDLESGCHLSWYLSLAIPAGLLLQTPLLSP